MLTTNKYLGGGMISTVIVAGAILAFLFTLGGDTRCAYAQASCGVGDDEIFAGSLGLQSGTAYTLTQSSAGNVADRAIAWGDFAGEPTINTAAQTLTSKTINGGSTLDGVVGGVTPAIGTFTNFTATTIDGVIGSVTPAAAGFTTVSATGLVTIGVDDATAGLVHAYGEGAGSDLGGGYRAYAAADHNATFDYWEGKTWGPDFYLRTNTGTAATTFNSNGNVSFSGDLDATNNDLNNVGNAGTDFTSTGATFGADVEVDGDLYIGKAAANTTFGMQTMNVQSISTTPTPITVSHGTGSGNPAGFSIVSMLRVDAMFESQVFLVIWNYNGATVITSRGPGAAPTFTVVSGALNAHWPVHGTWDVTTTTFNSPHAG